MRVVPSGRTPRPGWRRSQRFGRPITQKWQRPQVGAQERMTWSPTWSPWVPGPTASTTPAPSSPSTMGTGTPAQLPSAACRQL